MRFERLTDWLRWQETLHPRAIDLGLARIKQVMDRLGLVRPAPHVISVGGTNGKGSCSIMLEAILRAAGQRVGTYLSPHLLHYNERIRIDGAMVGDDALCQAFARIDAARGDISLTYFEFGTLAALLLFAEAGLDVAVLEVGLGGRLDAVNAVDADLALITSIQMDHMEWLGSTRDAIGREKAGIARPGRPVVCADPQPPQGFLQAVTHSRLYRSGLDYHWRQETATSWHWHDRQHEFIDLSLPALTGSFQLANAAAVIQSLVLLQAQGAVSITRETINEGLRRAALPGRFQRLGGPIACILDVAHNPAAAQTLLENLARVPANSRYTVLGMLADKDVEAFAAILDAQTDYWLLGGLSGSRGLDGETLARRLREAVPAAKIRIYPRVIDAYRQVRALASPGDRILVTGSFHTVAEVLAEQD
jgi:dihydrofolate synthase/folylpolyglutamate synthase